MDILIEKFFDNFPEYFLSVAVLLVMGFCVNYYIKYGNSLKNLLGTDYNQKISSLKNSSEDFSDNNSLFRRIVNNEIQILAFANLTGYYWSKAEKRKLFLRFYHQIKEDIPLQSFKLLFANSIICDNVVSVKMTKRTKSDLFSQYVLSVMMLLAFSILFFLSFYFPNKGFGAKFIYMMFTLITFFLGFIPLTLTISKQIRFKQMKLKYDGMVIE